MQVNSNLTPLNNYTPSTNKLEKNNSPTNNVTQANEKNVHVANFRNAASKVAVDTYQPTHTSRDKQGVSLYQQIEREHTNAEEGELVSRFHVEA